MRKIYNALLIIAIFCISFLLTSCKKEYTASIKGDRNVLEGEQITLTVETDKESFRAVWSSSNPEIATVNNYGVVTGIKEGTSTIKVTVGEVVTDALITVSKFEINISGEKYLKIGESTKLIVTHNSKQEKDIFFSSSNVDVATITDSGEVTAIDSGTVTITVNVSGFKKSFVITVLKDGEEEPIDDPNPHGEDPIDDPDPTPVVTPIEIYVPTVIRYDDYIIATANREVVWYSSDENILQFGEDNEIIIMDAGAVTIKAVDVNNKDAYLEKEVYVIYSDIAPSKIEIYNEEGKTEIVLIKTGLYTTGSLQLSVRAIDSMDGADTTVIWSIDNERIATITNRGLISANDYGTIKVKAVSVLDSSVYSEITIKIVSSTGN